MNGLKWWMRVVGALYLFLFVVVTFLKLPIRAEARRVFWLVVPPETRPPISSSIPGSRWVSGTASWVPRC